MSTGDFLVADCSRYVYCVTLLCYTVCCVTRRKQQRPGIAKNDNNTGTDKTTNSPTEHPPNSQRKKKALKPIHLSSDTPHLSRHSFPMNTQRTSTVSRTRSTLMQGQDKVPKTAHRLDCTRQCEVYIAPRTRAQASSVGCEPWEAVVAHALHLTRAITSAEPRGQAASCAHRSTVHGREPLLTRMDASHSRDASPSRCSRNSPSTINPTSQALSVKALVAEHAASSSNSHSTLIQLN